MKVFTENPNRQHDVYVEAEGSGSSSLLHSFTGQIKGLDQHGLDGDVMNSGSWKMSSRAGRQRFPGIMTQGPTGREEGASLPGNSFWSTGQKAPLH